MTNESSISSNNNEEISPEPQNIVFVIMPFGFWFDAYYETIYKPAISASKLIPYRADNLTRPSTIINDIWTFTQKAKIILADLSGKNPNVFYELGLAHALAKPAILITETLDDVPFDLRSLRVLEYNKNAPDWGKILQNRITTSIIEILESPLLSVLPTFLSIDSNLKPQKISEQDKNILELRRDIDLLRNQLNFNNLSHYYQNKDKNDVSDELNIDEIRRLHSIGMEKSAIADHIMKKGYTRIKAIMILNQILPD